jgi:TRAP transporter TAXI family solute receptor
MRQGSKGEKVKSGWGFVVATIMAASVLLDFAVANAETLRFSSANPGGAWYVLAVGMTEIIKKENPDFVFSVEPGGGYGSPIMVGEKKVNMGFSIGGTTIDAMKGNEPFKNKFTNIRSMMCLYNHYLQAAVLKKSGIVEFQDIKGKTLSSGPKGQISWFWAKKLLDIYRIDANVRSMDFQASVEAVKDGHIDMFFIGVPMPYGPMLNLSLERPMLLAKFGESQIDTFIQQVGGFRKVTIPKAEIAYKGTEEDYLTAGTPLLLITNTEQSEDLIYRCVKAIAEHIKDLENVSRAMKGFEAKELARDVGVLLHPGALKYYKEVGWR